MIDAGPPPTPPNEKTPAAMVVYHLKRSFWSQLRHLKDDQVPRISFTDPAGDTHPVTYIADVTETILMVETAVRDREWRLHFVPCTPLVFRADVIPADAQAEAWTRSLLSKR
jgi:hypothetical protein